MANPAHTLVDPTDKSIIDMLTYNTFDTNFVMKIEIDDTSIEMNEPIIEVQTLFNNVQAGIMPTSLSRCELEINSEAIRESTSYGRSIQKPAKSTTTIPSKLTTPTEMPVIRLEPQIPVVKLKPKYRIIEKINKHTASAEICYGRKMINFMCPKCGFETTNNSLLAKHYNEHIDDPSVVYKCQHCSELFPDGETLVTHKTNQHFTKCMRSVTLRWCKSCDVVCHQVNNFQKHSSHLGAELLYVFKIIGFTCSLCPEMSASVAEFRAHKLDKHPNSCNCEDCPELYWGDKECRLRYETSICEICGYICESHKLASHFLKTHTTKTAKTKTFECSECRKMFATTRALEKHKLRHKQYFDVCKECGATFTSYDGLKQHMNRHTDKKVYSCKICDGVLSSRDALRTHMNTHTGEKVFECETCGKSFNNAYNYRTHLSVHTGVKKYVCEVCGSAFRVNVSLRTHIAKHHPK